MKREVIRTARPQYVALAVAGVAAVLLFPAMLNGLPLMFPDSGVYLGTAWARLLPVDRSGFYGIFLRIFGEVPPAIGLWGMIVAQALIVAAILWAAMRSALPRASGAVLLGLTAGLVLLTSLPWHASQIMPDAFSGPVILLTWFVASRPAGARGNALLWFAAAALSIMHLTHVGLFFTAGVATLLVLWRDGLSWRELRARGLALLFWTAAILAFPAATNGLLGKGWTASPAGPVFLFARLNEDGLIQPWLDGACPRGEVPMLCSIRSQISRDSQVLLWDGSSPFHTTVWPALAFHNDLRPVNELRRANMGAILQNPWMFVQSSARGAWRQYRTFQAMDDECPQVCLSSKAALIGTVRQHRPAFEPLLAARPQMRGEFPKGLVRAVTTPLTALAIVAAFVLLPIVWRRRDMVSASLLAAVLLALIANAGMAGALSDVHDRYQSRVAWLAPLAVALVLLRWKQHAQRKSVS